MTNSINPTPKKQLRKKLQQRLSNISTTATHAHSADIISLLTEKITQLDDARTIATFAGNKFEPDLHTLHHTLHGIDLVYPLCGEDGHMSFHKVSHFSQLKKGKYGILEPNPKVHAQVAPKEIDIFLCPAMAYTKNGERLGKGGGYYDRYLAQLTNQPPLRMGVVFAEQIVPTIPTDSHDIPVDLVVTENGIDELEK